MIPRPITPEEEKIAEKSLLQVKGVEGTICETIREIFRAALLELGPSPARGKIMERSKVVFILAKRMNDKLLKYNKGDYEL
ncbi:MAG: hypothetical protein MUP52_09555 [Candidatus Aminicenantes bacterium]|nr:hypothetical protein [Candidatus Aminicenantes bacterium]